jgi:hypothetical protein
MEKYIISKFKNESIFWKKKLFIFVNVETELTLGYGSMSYSQNQQINSAHSSSAMSILASSTNWKVLR